VYNFTDKLLLFFIKSDLEDIMRGMKFCTVSFLAVFAAVAVFISGNAYARPCIDEDCTNSHYYTDGSKHRIQFPEIHDYMALFVENNAMHYKTGYWFDFRHYQYDAGILDMALIAIPVPWYYGSPTIADQKLETLRITVSGINTVTTTITLVENYQFKPGNVPAGWQSNFQSFGQISNLWDYLLTKPLAIEITGQIPISPVIGTWGYAQAKLTVYAKGKTELAYKILGIKVARGIWKSFEYTDEIVCDGI